MTTAEQKAFARKVECEEDGLYYARYFFKQRTGGKMIVAPHHKVIQQTLDRVIDGEIQRLIINVPRLYENRTGYHQHDGARAGDKLPGQIHAPFLFAQPGASELFHSARYDQVAGLPVDVAYGVAR